VRRVTSLVGLLLAGVALFVVGCGGSESNGDGEVRVVASTALIAEFAEIVAGDDAVVVGLVPAGADVHSFEPSPGVAASVAQADLILVNGYHLEEGLLDVIERNASEDAVLRAVSAGIVVPHSHSDGEDDDHSHEVADVDHLELMRASGDPHLWLDVEHAMQYVRNVRDGLIAVDPAHEDGYAERAGDYLIELQRLDDWLVEALSPIPDDVRQLVVFHDAFRYFAHAYGFQLLAAVLPAGAQADPSAGSIAELIEAIEGSGVRVVFAEPQFSAAVLEQVAAEAGVEVGTLYSVFAGDVDTYVEMMQANGNALVEALSP